jgi:rubredoxin
MTNDVTEISIEEMDALIERMESNLTDGLSPEPGDVRLILQILRQFATMQQKLEGSSYLKTRYLKLMGLVSSSESQAALANNSAPSNKKRSRKKDPQNQTKPVPPKVCHHELKELEKGQTCPKCEQGRVYKTEPASFIRITGQAPLSVEKHIMEQLRCNLCGLLFTAPLPDEVKLDGARQQKYGYSARAIMAISKFYMGNPYYRQESLQAFMNVPVTASTIYDQCALLVDGVTPVFEDLKQYAANAYLFNIDDTGNRILTEKSIEKPVRNGQGTRKRTGIYSSCLIATQSNGEQVVLFKTNIGHSGEWIDEILAERQEGLSAPIVMSDALSSNTPQSTVSKTTLCNSHSRRKFVDVINNFPEEVEYFIELYATVWQNDTHTENEEMTHKDRLAYHKKHSLPVMKALQDWCEVQLKKRQTEENNGLGRAIKYFLKHFEGLSAFCRIEGAILDNNLAERVIKLIVRGRKNSQFYKTLSGAHVGDVITSLIATCELNGINCFDYLSKLQQNRRKIEENPKQWLPWNYQETLEESQSIVA